MNIENQYLDLLKDILNDNNTNREVFPRADRTGTGTIGVFGIQMRHNMYEGFPLLTTKKVAWKAVVHEMLWFLQGNTNIRYLLQHKVRIWSRWAYKYYCQEVKDGNTEDGRFSPEGGIQAYSLEEFEHEIIDDIDFANKWGDLGPVYGSQWRKWPDKDNSFIDQITQLIDDLKSNPYSRRHIVTAWNPAELEEMVISGLPPCHCLWQVNCRPLSIEDRISEYYSPGDRSDLGDLNNYSDEQIHLYLDEHQIPMFYLDLQLYQRSADVFLGVPFNIASYAFLIHMLAQQCDMIPGDFVHTCGDFHIYKNLWDQCKEQVSRDPRPLPTLKLRKAKDIFSYTLEDFEIVGYNPHDAIKGEVSV